MTIQRTTALATLAALTAATPSHAAKWEAVCSNLSGVKVDQSASRPEFSEDAVKGASWTYRWDTASGKASLTLPASHASDGKAHNQEGTVSSRRGGFFTIVSALPGAVWVHAIYPESGWLLASQTTTKDGAAPSGRMLTGSCALSNK